MSSIPLDFYIPELVRDKVSPKGRRALELVKKFVEEDCLPADEIYFEQISKEPSTRWASVPSVIEPLKAKAKKLGLWNLFLCNYNDGPGYSNLEYGLMAQFLGRSHVAPEATNTAAPDTGNMELLVRYANPQQRKKWLEPLLDGQIRSAFLMTEKGVSSSNALNISLSAKKVGNGQVELHGTKWFASGAGDPRCSLWLTMALTNPEAKDPYKRHSVLVIDTKQALATGKAKVIRPLHVFGFDDAPHGHCEIQFDGAVVPYDVLDAEGEGFKLIQSRLGPGRIHHCMRLIGMGEEAIMQAIKRASYRKIFGKLFITRESFIKDVAERRIALERVKLLVLQAALRIDQAGPKAAKREISMAKIDTPRVVLEIVDWAVQVYGGEGVSQDTPLTRLWIYARMCRIADGPDEAHLDQLGRAECKRAGEINALYKSIEDNRARVSKL
ncbi:CYFA0S09e00364g1_1 [Cyberlindnera fabianii]|uniref:CYFA0S09e00364g1_1 n=1 Tax=Cyberlindnera fabianii TaxID=36022 RepID=A0A061B3N3_CYBFA|nr:putative acyl-CoA dehydrogenase IBR3 [Cyberlindnera fabianii]CDR42294.1 CYFA0S09e00364g1_1 [Cyberlindnera fabianii]